MISPHAAPDAKVAEGSEPAAISACVSTLTKRGDFLRAARGPRVAKPGFIVQMRKRTPDEATCIRVGFTCSKKVGNAVARNRAKRRLREISRLILPKYGLSGMDYVLIGRAGVTADRSFTALLSDFQSALDKLHSGLG